jgi:prophage regulatory protein
MQHRRIIRPKVTSERIGYSLTQLWRLERDGKFPRRVRLSPHAVGHFEDEVDDWIRNRVRGAGRQVIPIRLDRFAG